MISVHGRLIETPECDKEIAARENKKGAFTDFIAWVGEKGWAFCIPTQGARYQPVSDALVRRLLPDPPDGGSQQIGDWLADLPDLVLCWRNPNLWSPLYVGVLNILAEYFGIDLEAAEREREEILAAFREIDSIKKENERE